MQWQLNLIQVEGALKSLWIKLHQQHFPLMESESLLEGIRNKGSGWLTSVSQILVNAGYGVPTQFAFCP